MGQGLPAKNKNEIVDLAEIHEDKNKETKEEKEYKLRVRPHLKLQC